jgi:hypothetical protein
MAFQPIQRIGLSELREPDKANWATPSVSGRYWRRHRSVGKISPMEWTLWIVILFLFELPKPPLTMQIMVLGGAVLLRLLAIPVIYLIAWRCPSCTRLFSRKHEAGHCEHCGMIFPK